MMAFRLSSAQPRSVLVGNSLHRAWVRVKAFPNSSLCLGSVLDTVTSRSVAGVLSLTVIRALVLRMHTLTLHFSVGCLASLPAHVARQTVGGLY